MIHHNLAIAALDRRAMLQAIIWLSKKAMMIDSFGRRRTHIPIQLQLALSVIMLLTLAPALMIMEDISGACTTTALEVAQTRLGAWYAIVTVVLLLVSWLLRRWRGLWVAMLLVWLGIAITAVGLHIHYEQSMDASTLAY